MDLEDMPEFRKNQLLFRKKQIEENKEFLKDKIFIEFGVYQGHSILQYYSYYLQNDIEPDFYGFDSFEGLPEEKLDPHSPWHTGQFNLDGQINPELLNKKGINIIKGWFGETLNDEFLNKIQNKKIGLIHIDCDIYSSTLEVLEFLVKNKLLSDGTLLVYDDWGAWKQVELDEKDEYNIAEGRAHKEICDKYDLKFERVGTEIIDPNYYFITTFKYRV